MLEKSKPTPSNSTRKKSRALISLKQNKQTNILPADKGKCTVVLDGTTYKQKIISLLESGVYEPIHKDPIFQIERKVQKILSKHKAIFHTDLQHKPTPHHSKPPHLSGFPKIHKQDIPLRLIISSIVSSCYAIVSFLHKILAALVGSTNTFVKNWEHFIHLIKTIIFKIRTY